MYYDSDTKHCSKECILGIQVETPKTDLNLLAPSMPFEMLGDFETLNPCS